jgi:hypothetical protein
MSYVCNSSLSSSPSYTLDTKDEGSRTLPKFGNHLPAYTAQHPRTLASAAPALLQHKTSQGVGKSVCVTCATVAVIGSNRYYILTAVLNTPLAESVQWQHLPPPPTGRCSVLWPYCPLLLQVRRRLVCLVMQFSAAGVWCRSHRNILGWLKKYRKV